MQKTGAEDSGESKGIGPLLILAMGELNRGNLTRWVKDHQRPIDPD